MNSRLSLVNVPPPQAVRPPWEQQLGDWRDLLDACSRKSGRKQVHGLRVATLRLKAQLEHALEGRPDGDAARLAADRWAKQADKLRKALSPVRDTDVYLQMLDGLRKREPEQAAERCQSSEDCLVEIDKLERRLKRKRAAAAKELAETLEERGNKLARAGKELAQSLADPEAPAVIYAGRAIRAIVAGLAEMAPALTVETLHAFRKRAKTARYLAETAAEHDAEIKQWGALIKKMQNKAGTWHDWQMLAEEAERALGACQKEGLARLLESVAEGYLLRALAECRRTTAQLGERIAKPAALGDPGLRKKTVQQVESAAHPGARFA